MKKLTHKNNFDILSLILEKKIIRTMEIEAILSIRPVPLTRSLKDLISLGLITRKKETIFVYYSPTKKASTVLNSLIKIRNIIDTK